MVYSPVCRMCKIGMKAGFTAALAKLIFVEVTGHEKTDRNIHEYSSGYFEREVLPYHPDARIDRKKAKVGYEIPFTRTF